MLLDLSLLRQNVELQKVVTLPITIAILHLGSPAPLEAHVKEHVHFERR
jgi:hypothetical protein